MVRTLLVLLAAFISAANLSSAGLLQEAKLFAPIFKFDGSSRDYCYPDFPSASSDETCKKILSTSTPAFVQESRCGEYQVFTYWLWYGKQKPCIDLFDKCHGNDWEHVSVFCAGGKTQKLINYQHKGHYTRRREMFERVGERPVVYIGKVSHGSYHAYCNGRCSSKEFFTQGCLRSVNYCVGGCCYWDDFRNPDPELKDYQIHDLKKEITVDRIKRPDREICVKSCEGRSTRDLQTAGCWQDKP